NMPTLSRARLRPMDRPMKTQTPLMSAVFEPSITVPGLGRRPRWQWAAAAVVVAFVGWRVFHHRGAAKPKGAAAVPVSVVPARSGDMPVFLEGLGTVNAYYTATV